jgi:3-deoxy-7-phosphoheptulonate synthase
VRTFADHTRNTLDLSIIPAVQRLSHLPILVDPSHATGKRDSVLPMARAAVASGLTAYLSRSTTIPKKLSPTARSRSIPTSSPRMMDELEQIAPVVGRKPAPRHSALEAATA